MYEKERRRRGKRKREIKDVIDQGPVMPSEIALLSTLPSYEAELAGAYLNGA